MRRAKEKKGIEAESELHIRSREVDAFIGDEEENRIHKGEKKKQGAGFQPSYLGPFSCLLRRVRIIQKERDRGTEGETPNPIPGN